MMKTKQHSDELKTDLGKAIREFGNGLTHSVTLSYPPSLINRNKLIRFEDRVVQEKI